MPSFNFWEDGAQNYLHYALILVIVEMNSPQRLPLRRKKNLRKKLGKVSSIAGVWGRKQDHWLEY